jgi:predicted SprT family Zn-dependent metalloprotease
MNEQQCNADKENNVPSPPQQPVSVRVTNTTGTNDDIGINRHKFEEEEEQCGDSAGCKCCMVGSKSFLPLSMMQDCSNISSPKHQRNNNKKDDESIDDDNVTPKSSSSMSSDTDSLGFQNTFNHISFEMSPPHTDINVMNRKVSSHPQQLHTKSSDSIDLSNLGRGPDTSIIILDSSDDDGNGDDDNITSAVEPGTAFYRPIETPAPALSFKNYERSEASSPEAEWDGSLLDHHDMSSSDDTISLLSKQEMHNQSSFIVSSDESDIYENNEDDEVEWNDSDCEDETTDIVNDLIRRTKEIIILSSDSDDDGEVSPAKPQCIVTKKFPPTSSAQIQPTGTTKLLPAAPIQRRSKVESKISFRKRRMELSQQLFVEFDRIAFGSRLFVPTNDVDQTTVTVTWSNKLRTTAGLTRLSRIRKFPLTKNHLNSTNSSGSIDANIIRIAVIELSSKVIDDETRLRSTLLHEMCHAAAWVMDDIAKPAHGSCFQKWAKRASRAIPDIVVTTTHNYEIDFKYKWVCVNYPDRCNVMVQRHSRSVNVERQICGKCKGRLREVKKGEEGDVDAQYTTTDVKHGAGILNNKSEKKSTTASLSAYNEFVRVQAPLVRERWMMTGATTSTTAGKKILQSEVMKECARLWKEQKQQQQQLSNKSIPE